jgi:Ca-activated chloride channel family protein
MARYYGAAGIGISVFGVGLDMGTELADAISKTRGGNYFYLAESGDIRQVFDEEFDYIVTPLAYDLEVEVTPRDGFELQRGWGVPVDGPQDPMRIGASTLFLSARDGGMGLSFSGAGLFELAPGDELASFSMRYEEADGDAVSDEITVSWRGGGEYGGSADEADDVGVYKMAGLVDAFLGFEAGADFCDGALGAEEAQARMVAAAEHLERIAAALTDAPSASEAVLQRRLAENLRVGGVDACAVSDAYVY